MGTAADQLIAKSARSQLTEPTDDGQVGDPVTTVKMRTKYTQYNADTQSSGQPADKWEDWLKSEGYGVDGQGQVYKKKSDTNAG